MISVLSSALWNASNPTFTSRLSSRPRFGGTVVVFAVLATAFGSRLHAGEMKASLDCVAEPRLLDSRFSRYGFTPTRTIARENRHVRFKLPPLKDVGQTGIYSYFAMAGDFEVEGSFDLLTLTEPTKGYGASVGIALDTEGPAGQLQFARGQRVKEFPSYLITRAIPKDKEMTYDTQRFAAKAKSGKFVLKRQNADLTILVSEGKDDMTELAKIPFTTATVRKIRLFADTGGSPTSLDGRIGNLKVRAEEITGGIATRDVAFNWLGWLSTILFFAACVGVAYYFYWKRTSERDE